MKLKQSMASILLAGTLMTGVVIGVALPAGNSVYAAEVSPIKMAVTNPGIINVNGSGKLSVKPDIAYVSIGVQSTSTTAAKAQAETASKMSKLNNLLKQKWSIANKDIQSVQFYVQPNYKYDDKDGQKVTGYTAYHTLKVTYRNLEKLGDLLDAAAAAGANNLGSVNFDVENPQKYEEQVMAKAMSEAASKANSIAKAANRTLGELVSVSEAGISMPPMYLERQNTAKMSDSDQNSTAIKPGMVELSTSLNVQYAMQ